MSDTHLSSHFTGSFGLVARQHPDFDALFMQGFDGLYGGRLQFIRNGQYAQRLVFIRQGNDRLGFLCPFFGLASQNRVDGNAFFFQQNEVSSIILPVIDITFHTPSFQNAEAFYFKRRSVLHKTNRRFSQRVLGHLLQTIKNVLPFRIVIQPSSIAHLRMAFGQCARLVEHHSIDLLCYLQTLGILDEDAILGSLADAYHDSSGRGQAQGTRTSNDKHRHHSQEAMGKAIVGCQQVPCHKSDQCYYNNGRNKNGRYLIDQLLNGCLASLGILHHPDDLSQQGVLSYLVRHESESPFLIDGAGIYLRILLLADGNRLATEHTFVHIRLPFAHHSIHGNPLTGFHHHDIALTDSGNRKDAFPLRCQHRHGLGLKTNQLADSSRGIPFGTFLQQASQQDKGNDDTRCFEIDMRFDTSLQPKLGKEEIENTEHISNARAECHERIHVASAVLELFPGTDKEPTSQHEHHGSGK